MTTRAAARFPAATTTAATTTAATTAATTTAATTAVASRRAAPARAAFWLVFGVVTAMTLVWLVVGAVVAVTGPAGPTALDEPPGQAVVDYAASGVNLVVAVVLLRAGGTAWPTRLLALAMVGSAGAFNLQAHAATLAVRTATGLEIGELHQVLLHGVAGAAYAGALLTFVGGPSGRRARVLVPVVAAVLFLAGLGTALLPHTVSCVVFFGFGVPLLGTAAVGPAVQRGPDREARARARLLTSVLVAALGAVLVLALLTLVLALLGRPGLTLDDPTVRHGGAGVGLPLALLFWFARLTAAVVALAVLAARRARSAERLLHRGLAVLLVVVTLGGLAVLVAALVSALLGRVSGGTVTGWVVATLGVAVLWGSVSRAADRLAERLLHGDRATPAGVLAGLAAATRGDTALEGVPEAVGRALGARSVRLVVHRDGLRDRVLAWRGPGAGEEEVRFGVHHGGREIGALAVDAEALAGGGDRTRLVAEVADGLGGVVAAHRLEIELERQLRAGVAHAEQIAAARRRLVAETDAERRGLERDLHDGAQHHLVSLRLTLGLVEHLVGAGRVAEARERLAVLVEQLDAAEAVLAQTASGVSTATLTRLGLVGALTADLAGDPTVTVAADGVGRLDEAVESAAYFVCLEAVNNARKHAGGAAVQVRLAERPGTLTLEIADDGPGFTAGRDGPGRGLRNLASRLARVGGHVTVDPRPGEGTVVRAEIPLAPAVADGPGPGDGAATGFVAALVAETGPTARAPERAGASPPVGAPRRRPPDGATAVVDTRLPAVVPSLGTGPRAPVGAVGAPLPDPGSGVFTSTQALVRRALERVPVGDPAAGTLTSLAVALAAPWRYGVTGPSPRDCAAVAAVLAGVVERPAAVVDLAARAALGPLAPDEVVDGLVLLAEDDRGTRVPPWLEVVPTVGARVVPAVSVSVEDPLTGTVRVALPGPDALGGRNVGRLATTLVARCRPAAARRRAGAALDAAERLVAAAPGRAWTRWLAVELDRVRAAGARELAEARLAEELEAGRVALPDARRAAAARLLAGGDPRTRLGADVGAERSELARLAREQRAAWARLGGHPASGRAVREAAAVLVAACEALLGAVTADGTGPDPSS
ncbi:sensor histidine kinase [Actinomycetospora chiangmaiensis]|uniref:sensor histidine kinase n=1 Tax=Actinomycetospora chiangmaiensis TaxID=402650 RepID=UPI0003A3B301|nr:ATP-binding protein [Actinomycetospora chiangmaiensis]